ncbi:Bug family tripartite tricarboxylate transporter substrate binding protein [Rhodoplanes elegans]|uniref:Bug family tripartite tricarboxylate transporter substrate binding protein n=1 Tax=Rhodoplanes elegans TaxID=29408 RepID=UPI0019135ACA|nr:tripartite tricarboxylate transporter substrate binding protein [Rhodoplanes elegans]
MDARTLLTRRTVMAGGLAAAAAGIVAATVRASGPTVWPDRPVHVIVPYPAGGSVDLLTRIVAERLEARFGQTFVIENRPGAAGNIGVAAMVASRPDGYTIAAATVGHFAINPFIDGPAAADPDRDFAPVSLIYELPNALVIPARVPATTVAEFVSWAKQKGKLAFGSSGVGTSTHLFPTLFAARTGIDATHVPFRGAAQTIPAMLSGDVAFAIDNLTSYMAYIESGQIRPLALTGTQRWPALPAVPTMAEAGMPDFDMTSWAAFAVPAGTPRVVVDRLADAMRDIAADETVRRRFAVVGARALSSTPEQVASRAARERPIWKETVRIAGLAG